MSLALKVINFYLTHIRKNRDVKTRMHLEDKLNKPEPKTKNPTGIKFNRMDTPNGAIFDIHADTNSKYIVFYIHGGGYVESFSFVHWRLIKKIVKKTNARVITFGYRLAPYASYKEAYDLIIPVYTKIVEENSDKKIIVMGDSAGGGLALGIIEHVRNQVKDPDETILLSPWVDMAMDNPDLVEYEKIDGWLTMTPLSKVTKYWVKDLDVKDYRVSPIYGEYHDLKNVTVFIGEEELLYPDLIKLCDGLEDSSKQVYFGSGLKHVFPLLPVKEAKPDVEIILNTIIR